MEFAVLRSLSKWGLSRAVSKGCAEVPGREYWRQNSNAANSALTGT
jgi:hypothetical protein